MSASLVGSGDVYKRQGLPGAGPEERTWAGPRLRCEISRWRTSHWSTWRACLVMRWRRFGWFTLTRR
eukprot:12967021-Alexandrium_andersonii.AAC.1